MALRKKQREDEEFVNKNRIIEALKKKQKEEKINIRKKELIIKIIIIKTKVFYKFSNL